MSYNALSRGALTPTANGNHFQAPSEGVRARRGFTPRSASKLRGVNGHGHQAKPKLTVKQQLEILHRVEMGNFKPGIGLNQFYEEMVQSSASSTVEKMSCKQNLFSSFASVDPIACSTRNYGNSMIGSIESLISVGTGSSAHSTTGIGNITCIEAPHSRPSQELPDEDTDSLPDYMKTFQRLMSAKDAYERTLEQITEKYCAIQLSRLLPEEKMVSFFKSLDRVQRILQKFLQGNATENMKLFMPFPKSKDHVPSIHCDIEVQTSFINALNRLNEIMGILETFVKHEQVDFKTEAKIEHFRQLVAKLDSMIRTEEDYAHQVKDIVEKSRILSLGEDAFVTYDSSRGIRTYEDDEITPNQI